MPPTKIPSTPPAYKEEDNMIIIDTELMQDYAEANFWKYFSDTESKPKTTIERE